MWTPLLFLSIGEGGGIDLLVNEEGESLVEVEDKDESK